MPCDLGSSVLVQDDFQHIPFHITIPADGRKVTVITQFVLPPPSHINIWQYNGMQKNAGLTVPSAPNALNAIPSHHPPSLTISLLSPEPVSPRSRSSSPPTPTSQTRPRNPPFLQHPPNPSPPQQPRRAHNKPPNNYPILDAIPLKALRADILVLGVPADREVVLLQAKVAVALVAGGGGGAFLYPLGDGRGVVVGGAA